MANSTSANLKLTVQQLEKIQELGDKLPILIYLFLNKLLVDMMQLMLHQVLL